jgi:hypothetical protein
MTKEALETALDNGSLYARMGNGNYWKCRRNGKTQTWKTRPNDFRIPVKAGLKSCGAIDHHNVTSDIWRIGA